LVTFLISKFWGGEVVWVYQVAALPPFPPHTHKSANRSEPMDFLL
jgi:hypothetical protein